MRIAPIAAALALAGLAAACGHDRVAGPSGPAPITDLTVHEAAVSSANTAFGLALLRDLQTSETEPNLLVSPLSASMALGMALNGARGETYDAMRATLGFEGLEEDQINAAYEGLIRKLHGGDPRVEFALANAIWYEQSFRVNEPFLDLARRHFDARVSPLDFLDPASPGVINAWVEERTGGRIKDLVQSIDPLDRLFLVNAVYFKAPWAQPFEPNATSDQPFTRADGSRVSVPMMTQDDAFRWFSDDHVQAVELLYADSVFSMVIAAPADGRSLDELVAELTPQRWNEWMGRFERSRVMLRLPRFRFDYALQMRGPLERMGMGIAFVPRVADFQRIAPVDDLHISRVKHKSFIDVHELGTEAAAATAVVISVTSMPPVLAFDRPFIFAIRERSSGALLFVGRVGDPSPS